MTTTTKTTNDQKRRILWLRRTHTAVAAAHASGLPVGTVKSMWSRAGVRGNQRQREFFQLPPVKASDSTAIGMPKPLPVQTTPSGHKELDAVLWLRQVIETGEPSHIERALEAAKRITTPAKELETLYAQHVAAKTGNTLIAALSSMGFADLEGKAKLVIERQRRRRESVSRFGGSEETGEAVFAKTPQERFCVDVLMFVPTIEKPWKRYDHDMAVAAFESEADHAPHTLSDCIHELHYWDDLYMCRSCWGCGDHWPEVQAREDYLRWCMCRLRPVDKAEAVAVLDWAIERDALGWSEGPELLRNLIRNA